MEVELVPDPGHDDPAFIAAEAAIGRAGLAEDARPSGNTSAWWRAGVHEAVEPGVALRERAAGAGRPESRPPHRRAQRPTLPASG